MQTRNRRTVFLLLALLAVGLLSVIVVRVLPSMRAGTEQMNRMTAARAEYPHIEGDVTVRGWTKTELDKIVSDFLADYELPKSAISVEDAGGGAFRLTIS